MTKNKSNLDLPKKDSVKTESENTAQTAKELKAGQAASDEVNLQDNVPVVSNTSGTDQIMETAGGTINPIPDQFPTQQAEPSVEDKLKAAEESKAESLAGTTPVPTGQADNTPQNTAHTPATWLAAPEVGVPANAEIVRSLSSINPTEDNPLQAQIAIDCNIYNDTLPSGIVRTAKAGEYVEIIGKEVSRIQNNWYKIRWGNDPDAKSKKKQQGHVGYLPVEYLANIK